MSRQMNPPVNPQPEPRIGDEERAAAANALGEHYATGRLTREEYDERAAAVWTAKTNAQLRPLFIDLPPLGGRHPNFGPPAQLRQQPRREPPLRGRNFSFPWLPVIALVIGLSLLFSGPWWLLLVGAFIFAKTHHRGGCGGHPRRS